MTEPYHGAGQAETRIESNEARQAMREILIGHEAKRALAFQTAAVRHFGPAAGIFCRQLLFWDDKKKWDQDGFIYKSTDEFQRETGLSRYEQEKARKRLKGQGGGKGKEKGNPVLQEKRAVGPDGRQRLFYRLDLQALMDRLGEDLLHAQPLTSAQDCEVNVTGTLRTLVDVDHANFSQQPIQKSTQERTQKNSSLQGAAAAAAPQCRNGLQDRVADDPDPVATTSYSNEDETQSKKTAGEGEWFKKLVRDLEASGHGLDPDQKKRYGANLKRIIKAGHGPDVLDRVVDRIVSEWPRIQLSPQQALADVLGGRADTRGTGSTAHPSSANATPAPALDAIEDHPELLGFAHVARVHDFTSSATPSGRSWFALGGTDRERGDNAARLTSVSRRAVKAADGADRAAQIAAISPARINSEGPEDGPEGSSTNEDRGVRLIQNWGEWNEGRIYPVGVSDEIERAALLLQDPDTTAGRWMARCVEGRIPLEEVVKTVSHAVWGRVDLSDECDAHVREVVGTLYRKARSERGEGACDEDGEGLL